MKLAYGRDTDTGRLREGNEDAYLVDESLALFAVADGMGGHAAGEVASWTAVEALRAAVANGRPINEAISRANEAIIEKAAGNAAYTGMGTTVTAAIVAGGRHVLIGHVGDSRAYLLRNGELARITKDHTLVEELVDDGRITPEQAASHPQRSIVTRALGDDPGVEVDVYTVEVETGDRLVLCSDGLTGMIRERDVERIARDEPDPQQAAEALVDAANEAGGEDNITVVVLDVLEVDDDAHPDPEALAEVRPARGEAEFAPPPDVPDPPVTPPRAPLGRRIRGVALIVVPVVAVIAIAIGALGWYARRSYYVGVDRGDVVLFQGVPGGVLGWDPTVERRTGLAFEDVPASQRANVRDGAARGSRGEAEQYVERLLATATSTTTSTTTSTVTTTTTSTTTVALTPTVAP